MGVRGGRGSYASIHLPNSTAALPLYPTTACCKYLLGRDGEKVCSDNIRCLDNTKTQTSTDIKAFSFFLKCYHSSSDNHVEILITEEREGSGWNVKRCMMEITHDSSLGFSLIYFYWNYDGNCNFAPLFFPSVCCGCITTSAYFFVFIFKQHEIWAALADSQYCALLISSWMTLSFVDMFFVI